MLSIPTAANANRAFSLMFFSYIFYFCVDKNLRKITDLFLITKYFFQKKYVTFNYKLYNFVQQSVMV